MQKTPHVLFVTFSDLGFDLASSVNDKAFLSCLSKVSNVDVLYVKWKQKRSYVISYINFFFKLLNKNLTQDFDLIICRGYFTFLLVYAVNVFRRTIIAFHVGDSVFHSAELKAKILPKHTFFRKIDCYIFYFIERFVLSRAQIFITSSLMIEKKFKEEGRPVFFIPWVIPRPFFQVDFHLQKKATLNLIYIGGFLPHDRLLAIVDATTLLVKAGVKIKLTLVGDGPLLPSVKKHIIQNGIDNCTEIIGRCSRGQLPEFLKDSQVFVCPMAKDIPQSVIPIKILEAIASGRVVVTTQSGAIPRIFSDNLFYVKEPLCEGIAETIACINENFEAVHRKRRKAREIAWSIFAEDQVKTLISNCIRKIIHVGG